MRSAMAPAGNAVARFTGCHLCLVELIALVDVEKAPTR